MRLKFIIMNLKKLWQVLFPKPSYPTSDAEVIALMQSALQKQNIQIDISPKDLSFGYWVEQGKSNVVVVYNVFHHVGTKRLLLKMDKKLMLVPWTSDNLMSTPIDLGVDKDHLLEDSFYCWGLFVDKGHFSLSRFVKN